MTRSGPLALVLLFVFASVSLTVPSTQAQLEEAGAIQGMACGASAGGREPYPYDDADCWPGLPGAAVTLTRTDGILPHEDEATTDEDGSFSFKDVPHGEYALAASRTGYADATVNVTVDGEVFAAVRLEPQKVSVPVRVEDEDGAGLDAVVSWWGDHGGGRLEVTGGEGSLETTAGYHSLETSASGYARTSVWQLLDGEPVTLVLSKVPPQDAALFGFVRDQDGAPVADAVVEVYQWQGYDYDYAEPEPRPATEASSSDADVAETSIAPYPYYDGSNRTTTAADGSYRIHVWGGDVNLNVHKQGHAQRSTHLEVDSGEELRHDVELLRYPEKTARVEGRVLGVDGEGLRHVRISVWSPEYGIHECSVEASEQADEEPPSGETAGGDGATADIAYPEPYPYGRGCAITVHADGRFEGDVTPGYAVLEAWHDHWRTCTETRSSDGSMTRTCGPEYLSFARTLELPADATTELTLSMTARPAPNSFVSGYVVDAETQQAIPGVQVHFSNEETYGWGTAGTDDDGSFRVKVRDGHHRVSVWAEGYLPWQGTVDVPADGELSLDILLTAGEQSYGYCCYAYDGVAVAESADDGAARSAAGPQPAVGGGGVGASDLAAEGAGGDGETVEDLGGGLGPYDPEQRARQAEDAADNGAPGAGPALLALALLGAALVALRRRS